MSNPTIVVQTDQSRARLWKGIFLECGPNLLQEVKLQQEVVNMRGKQYTPRRFTYYEGDSGTTYRYSGQTRPANSWTPYVMAIKTEVEKQTGQTYNFVVVNYYPDGKSKLGWHSDDERDLVVDSMIASVSLGATRDFQVRTKPTERGGKPGEIINISLASGDLLTMEGNFQQEFKHCVPARAKVTNYRLNLTFRRVKVDR